VLAVHVTLIWLEDTAVAATFVGAAGSGTACVVALAVFEAALVPVAAAVATTVK
jgi:hypothetical protein